MPTTDWITVIPVHKVRSQSFGPSHDEKRVFRVVEFTAASYYAKTKIQPTDFGTAMGGVSELSMLVGNLAFGDNEDPDYANELEYELGSVQGPDFTFYPALQSFFHRVLPTTLNYDYSVIKAWWKHRCWYKTH
jgi:hypothetical protein